MDFSAKRNRVFNDWWSKRNEAKKRRFSDLSYSCWCRSRLWFGNNPESLWEIENYQLSLGKRNWQRFKCQCFLFLIQYWKTYRLFCNSCNRGSVRVGELHKNSWESFHEGLIVNSDCHTLLIYKDTVLTEEQIKAHHDFFARRYIIDIWKIFTQTSNKIEWLIQA